MILANTLTFVALLAAQLVAGDKLTKPTIDPPISPGGGLDGLNDPLFGDGHGNISTYDPASMGALPRVAFTYFQWSKDWMPSWIKQEAEKNNHSLYDFKCYEITSSDCEQPWDFCIHDQSPLSIKYVADTFVRLPVGMRQYVNHIMVQPGGRSAYTYGDNMVLTGDCRGTELIHEVGHNLNKFAYGGNYTDQNPFTAGQTWLAAYDNDTAVPDSYAQTSQSENHSQHTVIAVYDLNVKGGIAAVEPNWIAIYNQYTAIEMGLGTKLKPGGKCERRFQNTELVNIGSKRDLTPPVRRLAYPKIEVIETRSDNTVRECDHDHDH